MDPVFEVYLANASAQEGRCAYLSLPATAYGLQNALDKLRLREGDELYFQVEDYHHHFQYLAPYLSEETSIYRLNGLAESFSKLEPWQRAAFDGLLTMERQKKDGPITVERLNDLAHSTHCCHVAGEVMNEAQLGRFYGENGFLPELEDLPEHIFDCLDFEKLGREACTKEGGVFTLGGYVVRHDELVQGPLLPDGPPQKPDYTIRLTLTVHPDAAQGQEPPTVTLDLPATEEEMERAQEVLGTKDWQGAMIADVDSPLVSQEHLFTFPEELPEMNRLAQEMRELDAKGKLPVLKALLTALPNPDLTQALLAAERMDKFILDDKIATPEEVADSEIGFLVTEDDGELLKKYIDRTAYGRALMERDHAVLTPYGLIQQEDFQPMEDYLRQHQPEMGMT